MHYINLPMREFIKISSEGVVYRSLNCDKSIITYHQIHTNLSLSLHSIAHGCQATVLKLAGS